MIKPINLEMLRPPKHPGVFLSDLAFNPNAYHPYRIIRSFNNGGNTTVLLDSKTSVIKYISDIIKEDYLWTSDFLNGKKDLEEKHANALNGFYDVMPVKWLDMMNQYNEHKRKSEEAYSSIRKYMEMVKDFPPDHPIFKAIAAIAPNSSYPIELVGDATTKGEMKFSDSDSLSDLVRVLHGTHCKQENAVFLCTEGNGGDYLAFGITGKDRVERLIKALQLSIDLKWVV